MSYLVLARKHRPRDFAALVGQEHVVQALANALTQQRLHHAYLFTGTRGVGKTTVSRILAKSLNCTGADGQGGITAHPCGVCDACREIDSGRFVDYVELDAASNRGVDEISQLLDQAVYKPVMGRFKVYMIDEVHMLSTTAFNAMLKTLEEPPEYLKFVLATTDPQKVPPTVLSRCLQFNLRPMPPATVAEHLATVLEAEGIEAEAGALRLLGRAARGSMRDGLSLADQAIAYGAGRLQEAAVRQMLGAVDRGHAVRLVDALVRADGRALVETADGLRTLGLSAAGTLEEMAVLLQQMALAQALPDALDAGDPDAADARRLAGRLPADETQLLYSMALHGRAELPLAPDEHSGLVMVLLRMLAFRPGGPRASTEAAETRAEPAPVAAAAAAPVTAARASVPPADPAPRAPQTAAPSIQQEDEPPPWLDAPPADEEPAPARSAAARAAAAPQTAVKPPPGIEARLDLSPADAAGAAADAPSREIPPMPDTPLGTRWAEVVARLLEAGLVTALTRELAMQAQCISVEQDQGTERWRLRVEREILRAPAQCDKLQAALVQVLDKPVRLQVEAGATDDTPARREAVAQARRQAEAEAIIHNDPLVRTLLQQFKTARIVPGSIIPH